MKLLTKIILLISLAFIIGLLLGYLLFNKPEVVMANCQEINGSVWCMP